MNSAPTYRSCVLGLLALSQAMQSGATTLKPRALGQRRLLTRVFRPDHSSSAAAEVYVINLDTRVDKCRCMQRQLMDSPWSAHRFFAVDNETVATSCPLMQARHYDTSKGKRNTALICSNYLIWERFLESSDAQHLVIFEDDAIILDPDMWQKLDDFFTNPCQDWDYLMVDPSSWDLGPSCGGFNMAPLTYAYSGSHMQVFRRAAVRALLNFSRTQMAQIPVMDRLVASARYHGVPLKAFALHAGFTVQAKEYAHHTGNDPLPCEESVWTTHDRDFLVVKQPFVC